MKSYRRAFVPGASYFFTLVTEQRRPWLADADNVELLRGAFRAVRMSRPFEVPAMVGLPDHLHCIWMLPPGDADFSTRWRLIKTWFTKRCAPRLRPPPRHARAVKQQAVWQHRYWEHVLRDEYDFTRHVEYIHFNPIKHGLVATAKAWPYSSFHRYVEAGIYPADWGQREMDFDGVGAE